MHRILTCKNHPNLRWACKDQAFNQTANNGLGGYTGERTLFYKGTPVYNPDGSPKMYDDFSGLQCTEVVDGKYLWECSCPPSDLILAPEDALRRG
jgi:hypothetical protein